ncbi:MAG: helix-turn-helix transcriptional regulator [Gammaproteobacteria bacterium]|nr:helix-turn-helix transcriptional regulator [Gammaproteobacteria bacterium]
MRNGKPKINDIDANAEWDSAAFADRLKEVIGEESGYKFAQKCGFAEGMLRKYLSGVSVPGADKLVSIARVANVSLSWLSLGQGAKEGDGLRGLTPAQLAIVLEFERYAQRRPEVMTRAAIREFTDRYNEGLLEIGKIGEVGQVGEEELILWRDIAWERRTYKASIEEGILLTAIEIVDEFLTSSEKTMEPRKKAGLIAAVYRLSATTEGGVDRSMLVKLLMSLTA